MKMVARKVKLGANRKVEQQAADICAEDKYRHELKLAGFPLMIEVSDFTSDSMGMGEFYGK